MQWLQQQQQRGLRHGAEGPLRAGSRGGTQRVTAPAGAGGEEVDNARAGLNTC